MRARHTNWLICLFLISVCSLINCSGVSQNTREIEKAQLQKRGDGLHYAVNEEKPYSGKVVENFKSGQKSSEWTYRNGELEGLTTVWYSNGQKKEQISYKNGQKSGQWSYWARNGEKRETGVMTGNDGKTYKTVKIGNQWWLAENLRETQYRDGTAIPNVKGDGQWGNLSTGARCAYANNESNADIYGYLYNWYAAVDKRNIAPAGWRVPADADWTALSNYLGNDAGSKLAGNASLWDDGNLKQNASFEESGFSALPGGSRDYYYGYFGYLGYYASFWLATEGSTHYAWNRSLNYLHSDLNRDSSSKQSGFSVRLVRD